MARTELRRAARHGLLVFLFYSALFALFFAPALFTGRLLAYGDGLLYHYTFFQSEKVWWDTLLGGGFPMTADPQVMAWYPPSMLLGWLPGGWNLFVISAYVMASCFAYGYVHALTGSKFSAFVGGTAYGMCGFMWAHLSHTSIIHTAAWLPLVVWSLEMLRRRLSAWWLAAGCAGVACCVLAGHLQIAVYVLLLCAFYALALGWRAPAGRWRFYAASALVFLLGAGLAGLQVVPTLELAGSSARTEYAFSDFVSFSLPLRQVAGLIYPAAFGGLPGYGTTPYFGRWNQIEMTGYAGLLPLLLAGLGFVAARRKGVAIFWLCAGAVAFLLALGDQTPLAQLVYRVPLVNKFRVPARHFFEIAFAVSVLAGLGAQAIARRAATKRLLTWTVLAGAVVMLASLLALLYTHATEYAAGDSTVRVNMLPWANAAVAAPLILFILSAAALLYWHRDPDSVQARAALALVLLLDVAGFGWGYGWHRIALRKDSLEPPAAAYAYRDSLRSTNQRMFSVRGTSGKTDELPPNLSRLWEFPNAGAYGPLVPSRVTQLLSLLGDASADPGWKQGEDQGLNLMAARYLFLPRAGTSKDERGISWSTDFMNLWLGGGCDHAPVESVHFDLPSPVRATALGVVSRLACSPGVPDGTEVLRVSLTDTQGGVHTQSMLAGRDTSEWAYDCRTVRPQMKHRRATVFTSYPSEMYSEPCEGHFYFTLLRFDGAQDVRGVELKWSGGSEGITVEKLSLVNEPEQKSEPVDPLWVNQQRWRFAGEAGGARVYENLRAVPRAWLVPAALALKPEEVLKALKTSRLPDGRTYDPTRLALLEEEPPPLPAGEPDPSATARVTRLSDTVMEVGTSSASDSFLVTSDVYYTGWEATLDGSPIKLFRADYALRGVMVPAGAHVVRFEFRPRSFYYGAAASALSLLALTGLLALTLFSPGFAKFINGVKRGEP